jgi:ABC-type uncharacterized transport system substrate-binding protein
MLSAIRKLGLGVTLIITAATVLLVSDWNRRVQQSGPAAGKIRRVAIFQFAPTSTLDEDVAGMIDGLAKNGFVDGGTVSIQRFNAESDFAMANTIAKAIVSGQFNLVLTSSTPCLQAMANANKDGKVIHVFSAVTDPYGAGVGIRGTGPLDHPRHLVGVGSFQPVEHTLEIAREMYPGLKRVGVVWNTAEVCSEACVMKARKECKELGIELLEANVENSVGVLEAAKSLVGRGAQALWVGGDNTVQLAVNSVVAAAREGKIPVFTNDPTAVKRGVLFALGADYHQVGMLSGDLASRILKGLNPATIGVKNIVPERLVINKQVLRSLKDPWKIPPAVALKVNPPKKSQQETATRRKSPEDTLKQSASSYDLHAKLGRPARVTIVQIVDNPLINESCEGIIKGLEEAHLRQGRDFIVRRFDAQGDVTQLALIMSAIKSEGADLVVTSGTPVLLAAAHAIHKIPIVFTVASNPKLLGLYQGGQQPPNITGVYDDPPVGRLLDLALKREPSFHTVGTVWDPSEPNSEISVKKLRKACLVRKLKLVETTAALVSDLPEATESLCARGARIIIISADNLTTTGFPAILSVARKNGVPIYATEPKLVEIGAAGAIGNDFPEWGIQAGHLAAKVLAGVKPISLPPEKIAMQRTAVARSPNR